MAHVQLTVNGHEVARSQQRMHQFQIFLAGVTGGVHIEMFVGDDVRTEPEQIIRHTHDRPFVADDRRGTEDDGVASFDFDRRVLVDRDPRERGKLFALATGAKNQSFVGRQLANF